VSCPQPKRCACGKPVPVKDSGRGGHNRRHCSKECRDKLASARWRRRGVSPGCPHCPHCAAQAARVIALEEVAEELERQEWRSAAEAVRAMARRNPPEEARGTEG
jgi:hypothetical protein